MKNYIDLAHRTSAPVDPCRERLQQNPALLALLFHQLQTYVAVCNGLDTLKRAIFYGLEVGGNMTMPVEPADCATFALRDDATVELLHAGLGMATESGEFLMSLFHTMFEGLPADPVNLKEEVGDTQWYLAKACRVLGTTLELEQNRNIAKLAARFGDKFDDAAALMRDLNRERQVLEAKPTEA